jgi:hypothetical protein
VLAAGAGVAVAAHLASFAVKRGLEKGKEAAARKPAPPPPSGTQE